MRFLMRVKPSGLEKSQELRLLKAVARGIGVEVRNPKWASKGSLEVDVFSRSEADFQLFRAAIEPLFGFDFVHDLNVAPPHMGESDAVEMARMYFNAERYWECHEVLEGLWRLKNGKEKLLLQGMILVCASFVHLQKDEKRVALGVLRRALPLLDVKQSAYYGIQVPRLRAAVSAILESQAFLNFTI